MAGPQVTLTFAGDESKLTQAFDKVGSSAKGMSGSVGQASREVGASAGGFDRAAEASDNTYSKMDALESVGRGTSDTMSGLGEIMKGNLLQGSTDLAGGVAALADGFSGALLPAIKAIYTNGLSATAGMVRQTAAMVGNKVAMIGSAVATNVMTVAQKAMNLAMRANPIGLVVTALLALTAGVIWAYKNVGWFRAGVDTAMKGIKLAFGWAVEAGGKLVGWVRGLPSALGGYFNGVSKAGGSMVKWFQDLPGRIGGFFKGLASTISSPFRTAFNAVRNFWNDTIGGKGFSIPGWVPGIGGNSFTIPRFHTGGIVSGAMGSESLAVLKAGEKITGGSNSGDGLTLVVAPGGSGLDDLFVAWLKNALRVRGGLTVVLGSGK